MANQKNKTSVKRNIPLRTAGEKVSNPIDRPSQRLFAEVKRQMLSESDKSHQALKQEPLPPPTNPYHPLPPPTTNKNKPISPERDFTKVANSINRDALPSGLFKGTSKNTYDALYQRTRGAIKPSRFVKAIQSDVLIWTGLSHNTLRSHLKHLQSVGLIKIHYKLGDNQGATYEVFLPEEIDPLPPPTTPYHLQPDSSQKLDGGSPQKLVVGGGRFTSINIGEEVGAKTFLKTEEENIDDEPAALRDLQEVLEKISKKITGGGLKEKERGKWKELAELLAMELEVAAARTGSISSVPAFLTEHLRRRLIRKPDTRPVKDKKAKKGISNSLQIGKTLPEGKIIEETFEAEPLTEQGRATVLKTMIAYIEKGQQEFVMSLEHTYTADDWKWLKKQLPLENNVH